MNGLSEEWGVNACFELPSNTQQWDPGGRNMNFGNYCKRRASGRNNTTLEFSLQCRRVVVEELYGRKKSILKVKFLNSDLRTSLYFKREVLLGPQMRV
jgi:hypothetical protein